jgi:DNA mismatch repair ATPase MutS
VLKRLLKRPLLRTLLEEYLVEHSPLVKRYAERVAEVTGLPLEIVKRSQPVRNYARRILSGE